VKKTAPTYKPVVDPTGHIPTFSSYEEEAAWWDAQPDWSKFMDPSKPPIFGRPPKARLTQGLTIRFDVSTLSALQAFAAMRDVPPTALARTWIKEKMAEENRALVDRLKAEKKASKRKAG